MAVTKGVGVGRGCVRVKAPYVSFGPLRASCLGNNKTYSLIPAFLLFFLRSFLPSHPHAFCVYISNGMFFDPEELIFLPSLFLSRALAFCVYISKRKFFIRKMFDTEPLKENK